MTQENLMHAPFSLDIANSEDWNEGQWLSFTRDRLVKMRAKRSPMDTLWDELETTTNSVSFYDNKGMLQVNVPVEKNLCEIYMGRTKGKVLFDIIPDGQADINELMPTKYAMNFFLDGSRDGKENFWRENNHMRSNKSRLGSGIFFTGPRNSKDFRYSQKKDQQVQADTDLLDMKKFEKIAHETWFFFPKSIHPKDFFIDDNAWGQPDVQYAEDCIYKERISAIEFNNRYGKNKACKNHHLAVYFPDYQPRNKDDKSIDVRHVVLFHYFHRILKKYVIMVNETFILYNGLYFYDDGKLPFTNIQHYSNPNRFIGEGIPERVNYLKIYKSELFQDILEGAAMNNSVHLIVGNDDQIGQDWEVGGRGLNLWRTPGGADRVQPVNTSINLGYFSAVLDLIDKQVIADTGINPLEQINPQSDKVGIVEMMEANKAVRNASVDENYEIGIGEAFTMMLSRIKQFAPSLLAEKIEDENGNTIKAIFPKIRIDDMVVENKNGKQIFTESIGKYGYFDLKPDVVKGVGVKIVTASTNSVLPILERQKVNEFINNYTALGNMASLDPTGETLKKLNQRFPIDQIIDWMGDAYNYDINGLKANTRKDEIAQETLKKLQALQEKLTINPNPNVQASPQQTQTTPRQASPKGGVIDAATFSGLSTKADAILPGGVGGSAVAGGVI